HRAASRPLAGRPQPPTSFHCPPKSSVCPGGISAQGRLHAHHFKFLFPADSSRHLHHHKERQDRANGHCQPREPFKEKRIGKQDEIDELREPRIHQSEPCVHHQSQICHHQQDRNRRRNCKRRVNRHVVAQIGQQQVKRKKRAGKEKIVHRMQVNAAQRGKNEDQKEKEEERHRSKIGNPPRQRPRLQFLRHFQRYITTRHYILVIRF